MNIHHTLFLKKRFLEARHNISFYLEEGLSVDLLEYLGDCLIRDVSCDIFLSKLELQRIDSDAFLLNHLLKLRKLGAFIYSSESTQGFNKILCYKDFEIIYAFTGGHESFAEILDNHEEFNKNLNFFKAQQPEYRIESDDITIEFLAENNTVFELTATKIFWEVTNATQVTIEGIGKVASSGQKTITFLNDTILKLKATNGSQKKIKSIKVSTISEFKIEYEIQFRNPSSNDFVSMKESQYPGVFGIAKNYDIRLIWKIAHADKVNIRPFGFCENEGTHIFKSDGSIEINIEANFRDITKNKKILIYSFPIPVFERRYIKINEKILQKLKINIDDLRRKTLHFFKGSDTNNFRDYMDEMYIKSKSLESALLQKMERADFKKFYERHSIPKLLKNRKSILLNHFKSDSKIINKIKSLSDYYD